MNTGDLSGRVVSHYQIVKPLGAGGMGVVYLAKDLRLDRVVALKILPPEVSSDQERMRRFVREAKAASAIDHPNIVHVYEIDQADGLNFIAMQYVDGATLGDSIKGRGLSVEEFIPLAIQITDAIAEAHGRGIVHRDLKPANIMVSQKGAIKILDFGLAQIDTKHISQEGSEIETQTKTKFGTVIGTVAYMSPEQALGRIVDHRSDIFSLGIVFYQMLMGHLPFSGNTATETIDKIIHTDPDPPSGSNSAVPPRLELIIRKCLEKDPAARYQSTSEILIDLKTLKRDIDSGQSMVTVTSTRQPRVSQRKLLLPASFAALVIALGIFAFLNWHGNGKQIRALAVLPFKNINLDSKTEYLSDGITDSIINNISLIRQVRVMARGTVFMYKNKDADPRHVGKELGVDGVVTGSLLQQGDSVRVSVDFVDARDGTLIWGDQYDGKLADVLALQSQISKKISDKLRVKLTQEERTLVQKNYTQNAEAYQLYLKGQYLLYQRTPRSTIQARDYFQQAIVKDPSYALAYDGIANSYLFLGISGAVLGGLSPKDVMPPAKEAALRALELDDQLAQPHSTLGNIYFNWDLDWEGTERELQRAADLNPNYSLSYVFQSLAFASFGRNEEALAAIRHFDQIDPGQIPGTGMGIALSLFFMRQYDQSERRFQQIIDRFPQIPNAYMWRGLILLKKNDAANAIDSLNKTVTLSNRAPIALAALGFGYAHTGQTKQALKILEELERISENSYVPETYLAFLYGALQERDHAFALLDKAYKERANGLGTLKATPWADDLRADPRFQKLLSRLKLP